MQGINIIGHLADFSGLGNAARMFTQVLLARGVRVAALDVTGAAVPVDRRISGVDYVDSAEDLPYTTNLIATSIQLLPSMWRRRLPGLTNGRFVNIGLVFWELQVLPKAWVPSLAIFDAIVVSSQFVRSAIELTVPNVPTVFAEHPLERDLIGGLTDTDKAQERARLGIAPDEVLFGASFDLRSDFARKNPMATLEAFQQAFAGEPKARLLLKANGREAQQGQRLAWIFEKIQADPRVVMVDETLNYPSVMRLYNACDVYMSLHRAEGLGLGPLEAMLLGKAVLATGYSGNMTYMTEQNSLPVRYTLTDSSGSGWQYSQRFCGKQAYWAEPSLDAAVTGLRRLFKDSNLRRGFGESAKISIEARQRSAWAALFFDELCALALTPKPVTVLKKRIRQVKAQEVLDPVLRENNLYAVRAALK